LDSIATINFKSRDSAGTHFHASFLFAYKCPAGYYLPPSSPTKCVIVPAEEDRSVQRILGVLTLMYQCLATFAASLLLYFKRNERAVSIQSVWILATTTAGFWFMIEPPIVGVINDQFPCGVTFWFDLLWQPVLLTCVIMIMFRLYVAYTVQRVRARLVQKKDMDRKKNLELIRLGQWIQPRFQLLFAAILLAPAILTDIIAYAVNPEPFVSPNMNCREDTRIDVIQLIYFIVYASLFTVGLFYIRNARDAFGLGRKVGMFSIYYPVLSLIYFVLKFAASSSHMKPFDFRLLEWLICATYQTHSIIIPLLKTIPIFQRSVDEKNQEPLDEMLQTKLGFAYFYRHCSDEFSAENVLCWKAIDAFKRKTTPEGFNEIIRKFVGGKAIMQVNIPFTMEKKTLALKPETMSLTELQTSLDDVQSELLKLMIRDSFPRFLASPLGKRYAQKLPMEYREENDNQMSTGGSSKHVLSSDRDSDHDGESKQPASGGNASAPTKEATKDSTKEEPTPRKQSSVSSLLPSSGSQSDAPSSSATVSITVGASGGAGAGVELTNLM